MPFSRRTWLAAIDVIETNRYFPQAKLSGFFIELGPAVYREIRDEKSSAEKRLNDLKVFIDDNPGHLTDEGPIEEVVVAKAIGLLPAANPKYPWVSVGEPTGVQKRMLRLLEQDGFVVAECSLRRALPSEVGLPEAQSELMRLLDRHGLPTPKGHLDQALENHATGNWAAANSQVRSFLEGLLDELAVKIDPSAAELPSGNDRRMRLSKTVPPFLSRELYEWTDDGKNFINGLMKRLHPAGSHPGLSDEDDSTFRLHVVLLTARLLLARYDRGPVG